jgi:hypothetical protein
MKRPFARRRNVEQARADVFDAALSGELPREWADRESLAAELRAARLLEAAAADSPAPHEALVAMRAALAAKSALARPRWQHLAYFRAAPALALATIVALLAVVAGHGPESVVRDRTAAKLTQVVFEHANSDVEEAQAKLEEVQQSPNPAAVQQVTEEVKAKVDQVTSAAQALPPDDPKRRDLEAKVRSLQAQVAKLTQTIVGNVDVRAVPTTVVTVPVTTTTTTARIPSTTTTTAPPTTTSTTAPATTTTTSHPTTTSTSAPTTTTSSTVLSDPGTGTTGE